MTLIYALTEPNLDSPGFINASVQEDGSIKLVLRTSGASSPSELVMSREDYANFTEASRLHLADPFEMPAPAVVASDNASPGFVKSVKSALGLGSSDDSATLADGASPG